MLVDCALHERVYNPYYHLLASRLAKASKVRCLPCILAFCAYA